MPVHIAHIAPDAKDAWGRAVPFETWFVSLDGDAWLEVVEDPHGANVEQVKPLFAGEETIAKDGVKRKAYNIRIATRQIRLWGAKVLS
jgi:hypothetical protein